VPGWTKPGVSSAALFCLSCRAGSYHSASPNPLPRIHPPPTHPTQQGMCRHYVFVSSAGAYKANNIEPMHFEGDERKSSAGERVWLGVCVCVCGWVGCVGW
jgi:hypothetical protein